jgi:hypothetical protein
MMKKFKTRIQKKKKKQLEIRWSKDKDRSIIVL